MSQPFVLPNQAAAGFSDASNYDKHRPTYPPDAISRFLHSLGATAQEKARVVDLGSGTGKLTEILVARPEKFEVVAVEPHEGMRHTLIEKHLSAKVLDGNATSIPLEEGWGDVLVAGQAFHWFATEETLKEIHRVLRPGATFGMIWNVEDYNAPKSWEATTKWEQKLKDVIAELDDGHPRFRDMKWKDVFENQLDSTPWQTLKDTITHNMPSFSLPLGEDTMKWTEYLSDEGVWSRYATLSQIANLDKTRKEDVRKTVLEALKGDDVERNGKGEIAVHGATYWAWTSRV